MSKLNIGITLLNNAKPMQEMLSVNGITQNCLFLYQLLVKLGHQVFFATPKPEPNDALIIAGKNYRAISTQHIFDQKIPMDLLLEAAVATRQQTRNLFRSTLGTRIVAVQFGNAMIHDMERLVYPLPDEKDVRQGSPDAVWASPHFSDSFSYLETLFDAPVYSCPYIWEPQFVSSPFQPADYREKPNIQVMESNISLMKNALIPISIAERLCRENPDNFDQMYINGSMGMAQNKYFKANLLPNMTWLQGSNQKILFGNRRTFEQTFQQRDILLSHQWGCELNYVYLEALYKNIPLVHNSPRLKNIGYYYEGFDVEAGCQAVKRAAADTHVQEYQHKGLEIIKKFSIHQAENQAGYQELIDDVMTL